ncbi:7,8-didemethyl-8-hydroxy-5-deazariboflavin synthase subunit CofG [Fischerella thermalis]|jgi:FO synthase subunit 1|uniref:7,8-didemethyl-8-hydroxy-5-deazariboflavin synthase n=2 Tax=Fischerella TaxID=1190 RepID=G6FPK5_9CYAN|nr:7,8-didemethyl-8-hydroxy-5-deazariboflavin synthase subunit CofG [Fischerella thermalis]PLZ79470.1 7,8-didemethyl-8-hydroxy-5-deazariboflavin synthase subunit CofG [Fischerella thermalis WC217]PMB08952.1 7,8-didemethyl-8-hydroxy-5-deazariboflavin synthase subunit CofG [Fischerella thermalis CCMEE 5328]EHC18805.1 FO synthase subunit 1 [Fischerella thermalis JSC-11]PLZ10272.1 7,8-didemethyl-8-hydroxy-5-deazariboflavin synthase subunit CofG [Fischerella thermalis WC119]PLZ11306.1 7,8-didemethy
MNIITYSPAYTIVPTYECFNLCTYCNFRTDPGKSPWLRVAAAANILKQLQTQNVCEILILSGEVHPQSSRRSAWFQQIYDLCKLALTMGFLPHTNAGPLSFEEMQKLKQVNVSMGLMLEQLTPELLKTVHKHAPSKLPAIRLQQLEWAGELQIPFTTGLLLGIGETENNWWETLEAIANFHQRYHHIQEVILQPHSPGNQQSFDAPPFDPNQLPEVICKARQILPSDITIQIPPNLVKDQQLLLACIEAGARDLGGIGPKDEVNPDYPHIQEQELREILQPAGWELVPRLPVYPQFDSWLLEELQLAVKRWRKLTPNPSLCQGKGSRN